MVWYLLQLFPIVQLDTGPPSIKNDHQRSTYHVLILPQQPPPPPPPPPPLQSLTLLLQLLSLSQLNSVATVNLHVIKYRTTYI